MRALIGMEWDLGSWNGDVQEDPDEAGNTEPLNSDKTSLPMERPSLPSGSTSPTSLEGKNPASPEDTVSISLEVAAMQDNADSPPDPPYFPSWLLDSER